MRRRLARHGARPLRAHRAARGAAHRVRRVARRLARPTTSSRRRASTASRPRVSSTSSRISTTREDDLSGDPVLERQPLRRPRGLQERQGLPQRPGAGTAHRHPRRARRRVSRAWCSPSRRLRSSSPAARSRAWRRRCAGAWWARRSPLLFVLLCGLCLVVPGLVVPTFSRIFVDEYLVVGARLDRQAAAAGHGRSPSSSR